MADYRKLKPIILRLEGGYTDKLNDGYACTNKGVTIDTFRSYFGKDKTCADLKKITDEQWDRIFLDGYWNKWKADEIEHQAIANLLVDWTYTSGKYGIIYPQQVLGVTADGIVGPKTLAALNGYGNCKELFQKLWDRRKKHFESLNKPQFIKGWLNRLDNFKWEG